jgi:hypothetical protein
MTNSSASPARRQALNMIDRMEIVMNDVMLEQGTSGYETQFMLELDGRIDVGELFRVAREFGRLHPVVTARLHKGGWPYEPYWEWRGDEASVHEHSVPGGDVLPIAGRLLATPRDLTAEVPLSLHLVHRADGKDVFMVQLNHVLADIKVFVPVLTELDRIWRGGPVEPAAEPDGDLLLNELHRLPRTRRLSSMLSYLDLSFRKLRRPAAVFGTGRCPPSRPTALCYQRRVLSAEAVRRIEERHARATKFSSFSMVLLASVYRAVAARLRRQGKRDFGFATIIGVDLGVRPRSSPVFHNLVSGVTVHASADEMKDRDELGQVLSARLSECVRRGEDWALVECGQLLRHHPRLLAGPTRKVLTDENSFGFGYFGSLDALAAGFCGARVLDVTVAATTAPPGAMSLLCHRLRGALSLDAVYIPELLTKDEVASFLDTVVYDVAADSPGLGKEQSEEWSLAESE